VALVLTYMTLLVLFVGPVGLRWYLLAFRSEISEASLSALTVTSPFSAALSIPLPRSSLASPSMSDPLGRPAIPLGPAIPGLGLPVWGAYLLLTPPLCLVLFALTYLAFRWRWWKAGITI
jgi:hypothetical protein